MFAGSARVMSCAAAWKTIVETSRRRMSLGSFSGGRVETRF